MAPKQRRKTFYLLERFNGDEGRFCEITPTEPVLVKSCNVQLRNVSLCSTWDRLAIHLNVLYSVDHGHLKVFDVATGDLLETVPSPSTSFAGVTMADEEVFVWTFDEIYLAKTEISGSGGKTTRTTLVKMGATQIKIPLEVVRILLREKDRLGVVATFNAKHDASFEGTWWLNFAEGPSNVTRSKLHDGRLVGVYNYQAYVHYTSDPRSIPELIAFRLEYFDPPAQVSRHQIVANARLVAVCEQGYLRYCHKQQDNQSQLEIVDLNDWTTQCKTTAGPGLRRWVDCAPVPALIEEDMNDDVSSK